MKRILLRSPNWIGDQVLAYPFYRTLRDYYPKAWITAVCTAWVKDIQFRGLVDEVIVFPKNKDASLLQSVVTLKNFSKILKEKGPWDLGIALPNSFSSGLLLKLAGAVQRRGYNTDARGMFLTQKLEWNPSPSVHRAQAYLNLLQPEGIPSFDARNYWTTSEERSFDSVRYWPDANPIEPPREDYFLVAPGATAESRRWSVDQFSALIEDVYDRYGFRGVVIGGKAEKSIANEMLKRGLPVVDFTAMGSVAALWKLFRHAHFTLCNESGLAHVASLCGSKVHIVCGAADPKRTQPMGPGPVQVSFNPIECWPCERNVCKFTDSRVNQCLKGISPSRVVEEIERGFFSKS